MGEILEISVSCNNSMNDLQTPARQNLGPLPKVLLFVDYI